MAGGGANPQMALANRRALDLPGPTNEADPFRRVCKWPAPLDDVEAPRGK